MKDDKRLKRKVRNSYIVSTVSIMLVLFLLGSVGYLMVAAMKVAQTLQESIAVTVELQNGISDQQRETINKRLTAEELVATVAYVTKEEKADDAEFRKMFESEFEEILDENPLLDSFELTLTAESADKELLDGFIASVSGIAGVERLTVAYDGGAPCGFAGSQDGKLEMLFVAPEVRGRGVGRALLAHAVEHARVRTLDVNEQNPQAVGFYEHEGFVVAGRSPVDDAGRPFPLLHMRLV